MMCALWPRSKAAGSNPNPAKAKRPPGLVLLVGILIALLVAVFIVVRLWPPTRGVSANPFATEPFDQSKWIRAKSGPEVKNPRGPMAEDLRRHYLQRGMSKKQVRQLLGPPSNSEYEEAKGNVDSYFLGHWGDWSIDGDYLIIRYHKSGRVASTEIYEH